MRIILSLALLAAGTLGHAARPARALAETPLPIYLHGMQHIDPIQGGADSLSWINSYNASRTGVTWTRTTLNDRGIPVSAQMSGPYAEAAVRQGGAADFATYMPGGLNHLGTHLHEHVKQPRPYAWRTIQGIYNTNPDSCRVVLSDQIPWVNQIFTLNGADPVTGNAFFHGSHATYATLDEDLFCSPPSPPPFANCFTAAEAVPQWFWVYRADWGTYDLGAGALEFVKLPVPGKEVGYDQLHGPFGFEFGTVPYQKRDFLRVYLDWREAARRGVSDKVRVFCWMLHAHHAVATAVGTDGRSPRVSLVELLDWLAPFIGALDESGRQIMTPANAGEIQVHHAAWSASHAAEESALQATIAAGGRPLLLPAIHVRLDSCFYVQAPVSPDSLLVLHELEDRTSGSPVYVAWSRKGSRPLTGLPAGTYTVLHGDGTSFVMNADDVVLTEESVVLEPSGTTDVQPATSEPGVRLRGIWPNPGRGEAWVRFTLPAPAEARLTLHDVAGRRLQELARGAFGAGEQSVRIDASGRAPGAYLVRLRVGREERSVRWMLVR